MSFPPVVANISNQQFTPEEEFFGIPLVIGTVATEVATAWAAAYPDNSHTLEVTPNNYKTAMAAIGFTDGDAHWKRVVELFSQPVEQKVTKAILGRRIAAVAKVMRVTVVGFTDGNYSIQVNADTPLVYAAVGKTAAQIRTELLALFAGNLTVSAVSQGAASIDITALAAGLDFDLTLASPGDTMIKATQTPNTGIGGDLTTARAENQSWFDIVEVNHTDAAIKEAAKWAQANVSHFWAETNASAVQSNSANNVAEYLADKGYTETSIRFHHTGSESMSAALMGQFIGFELGQRQVSHRRLVGVTAKNYSVIPGALTAFEANNVGWYDKTAGGRSLYNRTCNGGFIEMERGKWIVKARIETSILAGLTNNSITAYTDDEGVAAVKSWMLDAIRELGTGGGSGYIRMDTVVVVLKTIEQMGNTDNSKLKISGIEWSAMVRIGTNEVELSGYLSVT